MAGIPHAVERVGLGKYGVSFFTWVVSTVKEKFSSAFTHNHHLSSGWRWGGWGCAPGSRVANPEASAASCSVGPLN